MNAAHYLTKKRQLPNFGNTALGALHCKSLAAAPKTEAIVTDVTLLGGAGGCKERQDMTILNNRWRQEKKVWYGKSKISAQIKMYAQLI